MSLKNIIIGIAIIILTISVAVTGINIFLDKPEYKDFCSEFKTAEIINDQTRCEEIGGQWTDYSSRELLREAPGGELLKGFCDRDFTCRQDFEDAREKYAKTIFIVAIPLGIIILAFGAFFFSLEAVGAGLMGGGIGTILYGVGEYWRFAGDILRFLLSLVGLVALIALAYWFNSNDWNIWKKIRKRKK